MRPPAAVQQSSKPSRQEIAARLAAKKGKPADSKATQQDIQAKVALQHQIQRTAYHAASDLVLLQQTSVYHVTQTVTTLLSTDATLLN